MTAAELEAHHAAALTFLKMRGCPPELVALTIIAPEPNPDGSWTYERTLGATDELQRAMMHEYAVRQMLAEARQQTLALGSAERCPACGSSRYGSNNMVKGYVMTLRKTCMACGHEHFPKR